MRSQEWVFIRPEIVFKNGLKGLKYINELKVVNSKIPVVLDTHPVFRGKPRPFLGGNEIFS